MANKYRIISYVEDVGCYEKDCRLYNLQKRKTVLGLFPYWSTIETYDKTNIKEGREKLKKLNNDS